MTASHCDGAKTAADRCACAASAVTLVVPSCDKYEACWDPLFLSLEKFWPDCPFAKVLFTNKSEPVIRGVRVLALGEDRDWSSNLLCGLEQIDTPFVLLIVEDGWFTKKVLTAPIFDFLRILADGEADYLRLRPSPPPDFPYSRDGRLGILAEGAAYRTASPFSIWRKGTLGEVLKAGESAWDFELTAPVRTRTYGPRFLSTRSCSSGVASDCGYCITDEINAVVKGRWTNEAREFAAREGIAVDFGAMPFENNWQRFVRTSMVGRYIFIAGKVFRNPGKALRRLRLMIR